MARLGALADVCLVPNRRDLPCFDLTLRDLLLSPAASLAAGLHRSAAFFSNFRSTMTKRKVPVPITYIPSWLAPPKLALADCDQVTIIRQGINTPDQIEKRYQRARVALRMRKL